MTEHATAPVLVVGGEEHMRDAKGALVPVSLIRPQDRLQDETVRKVMGHALALNAQIARFRQHTFDDLNAFQALLEQEYGARAGGAKGNVSFLSFDGRFKVQVAIADQISFGPELQTAKKLIDECLVEWGAESRPEIRALVNRVFSVEKEGQINRAELFGLLKLEITDERWVSATRAIRDAIRVIGTREYVRFYMRERPTDQWHHLAIDIASAA
jgi:hypothetical protein